MSREVSRYTDFSCDTPDCERTERVHENSPELPVGWMTISLTERIYEDPDDYMAEKPKIKSSRTDGEFCSRMCAARFVTGIEIT